MAAVFLSYAKADRAVLDGVLKILHRPWRGVFWDKHIRTGTAWSRELHKQLRAADCVVVLWSRKAVSSDWVRHEATVAAHRGVIVSAIVDDLPVEEVPLLFRHPTPLLLAAPAGRGAEELLARVRSVRWRRLRPRARALLAACPMLVALVVLAQPTACNLWYAERAGIVRMEYGQRSTRENEALGDAVRSGRRIDLLMPDANEWTQLVTTELHAFFAKRDVRMRVLFADPGGTFYSELAMMLGGPNYVGHVEASRGILESDADANTEALDIHYFDEPLVMSTIIFDGETCLLSLNLPPGAEAESLRLELRGGSSTLVPQCTTYFESVWRRSKVREVH